MNAKKRTKSGRRDRRTITDLEIVDALRMGDLVGDLMKTNSIRDLEDLGFLPGIVTHATEVWLLIDHLLWFPNSYRGAVSSDDAKRNADDLGLVNRETRKSWDDENDRFDYFDEVSLTKKGRRVALILASVVEHKVENHKDDPVGGCYWCQTLTHSSFGATTKGGN